MQIYPEKEKKKMGIVCAQPLRRKGKGLGWFLVSGVLSRWQCLQLSKGVPGGGHMLRQHCGLVLVCWTSSIRSNTQWEVKCMCLELGDGRQGHWYTSEIYWGGRGNEESGGGHLGCAKRMCIAVIESYGYLLNLHFGLCAHLSVGEQLALLQHKVWNFWW